jgi:DNA-binding beta-propeller fold protein YncE
MGNYSGSLIYLAAGSEIRIFPESGYNQQQIGSITDGVNSSYGLFVDGKRDLFVANAKTISAYLPGTLSPYIVLSDSAGPLYVVKDHSGRVYASNRNGTVSVFQPGQKRPTLTLHTPGTEADGIDVDDESNVYVAYRGASGMGSIKKFKPDSRDGRILGMQISQPQGLQLDHAGNILVVDTGKEVLDIFRPHRTSPSQVIQAGDGATQVVLREANDNMYLSDYRDGSVYISHYPPGQFELEFDTDSGAQGMALSNEER